MSDGDKHSDLDALTALLRKHKSLPAEVISCMEGAALMDDLSYRICVEASGDNFYTFLERQAAEIERLRDRIARLDAENTRWVGRINNAESGRRAADVAEIERLHDEIAELRAVNIEQAQAIGRLTLGLHQ